MTWDTFEISEEPDYVATMNYSPSDPARVINITSKIKKSLLSMGHYAQS